jgi:hypothetical protein
LIKGEVDKLLRLGMEITGMSFYRHNPMLREPCVTARNMRASFCQDGSLDNMKKFHFIFHQLPESTHRDVMMHRESHGEVSVRNVMQKLNVAWAPKREGETVAHTNCIAHMYSRIMNERKQTAVRKGDANTHNRIPFARAHKNPKDGTVFYVNEGNLVKRLVSEY